MIWIIVGISAAVVAVLGIAFMCVSCFYLGFDSGFIAGLTEGEAPSERLYGRYEPRSIVAMAGMEGDWPED